MARGCALLDVFEAEFGEKCGSDCHPEDVFETDKALAACCGVSTSRRQQFLAAYLNKGPAILQGYGDKSL